MGYDTINQWLPLEKAGVKNLLSHLENQVENTNVYINKNGDYAKANLGNYKILANNYGITLMGSLPKWYLNNNLQDLTRGDTERAIEKLSDTLLLPMNKAIVKRVDFGVGFNMNFPPELYYPSLGDLKYFHRLSQPRSINYNNPNKQLIFYNKIAECKHRKVSIPKILLDTNILRYEMRWTKKIPYQFNMDEILVSDLYNESFYIKLIDNWEKQFNEILKIRKLSFKMTEKIKPNDIIEELVLVGLNTLGHENVLDMINEVKKKGLFEHSRYESRTKKMIYNILAKENLTEANELTLELENKIKSIKSIYR